MGAGSEVIMMSVQTTPRTPILPPPPPPTETLPPPPVTRAPERPPLPPPPYAPPPPRRRRTIFWIVGSLLLVVAVVAGILVWNALSGGTESPGLQAPTGLQATSVGYDSVTLGWESPGEAPSMFIIVRDGQELGRVPGTETLFTDVGLQPGTEYRYTVAGELGGERTPASPELAVTTLPLPPLSEAALAGSYQVRMRYTSVENFPMNVGERSNQSWTLSPGGWPGAATLQGILPSGADFRIRLHGQGQTYRGVARAQVSSCGLDPFTATAVRDRLTVSIRPVGGSLQGGTWVVDRWVGTIVDDSPPASSGTFFCPAGGWSAALRGNLT